MRYDEAWQRFLTIAHGQHGAVSRRQARDVGFDRRRVASHLTSGALLEPINGVLVVPGAPPSFAHRVSVATLAGGGTVASHRAAALLHGFDGIDAAPVEVTVKRGRSPDIDGVVVHRSTPLDGRDLVVVDGVVCTSIARTLCDLGAVMAQDLVEQCLDWALRRGVSQAWIEDTLRRVMRPGPTGNLALQRILTDPRRSGGIPQTWFERLVRRVVDAPDLPEVVLQHELRVEGRVVARLDLALPAWHIGLEAHSAEFHDRPGRRWRDLERDNAVKPLGWDVIYITWALAQHPDDVLDLIRSTHHARSAPVTGS